MSLPSYARDFRGHPACPCLIAWLPVYEAELQRRGFLRGPLHIYQLIGGYEASAGAHAFGGAFDVYVPGHQDDAVGVARQMGADATWHRLAGWDNGGGIEHDHGVLTGCPHALRSSVAANQITAVKAGFDGLGHLGRGGRDTGPRPLSGRTWQQGIEWAEEQQHVALSAALDKVLADLADEYGKSPAYIVRAAVARVRLVEKGPIRLRALLAAAVALKVVKK